VIEEGSTITKQDNEYAKRIILDNDIEEQLEESSSRLRSELNLMSRAVISNENSK